MEKLELYFWVAMYAWVGFKLLEGVDHSPMEKFWFCILWPVGVIFASIDTLRPGKGKS